MKSLHFGAGNIGRGFIGLVLSNSSYEVTFADVNSGLIQELKTRKEYTVKIVGSDGELLKVKNVTGIDSNKDKQQLVETLANVDLITTAVGVSILKYLAEPIAESIRIRMKNNVESEINVIACENAVNATSVLQEELYSILSKDEIEYCNKYVGFPNSAVDRIVPNQSHDDILHVEVEPFFEWVIEKPAIKGSLDIADAIFAEELRPYIERKLFTVNTGHATTAYVAYNNNIEWIDEAIANTEIKNIVRDVLMETGNALISEYNFDSSEHIKYIEKTLSRFANSDIRDEVVRVARSPKRKLGKADRFVRPLELAIKNGTNNENILKAMAYALKYDFIEDEEAIEIQSLIKEDGLANAIRKITSLENSELINVICNNYDTLNK